MSAGVDVEAHRAAVRSGLAWLYDTEQPERAILQHHGESLVSQGNRNVRFIPSGWAGRVVIVVDVTKVEYGTDPRARGPLNPLAAGELDAFTGLLADLARTVVHTWNGHPAATGSLALAEPAHPSLQAAVSRYLAGCPRHHTTLCRCGWYGEGNRHVIGARAVHHQLQSGAAAGDVHE
ncbi:hypothetical protein H7J06_07890 [Mycobacterium hodleri]|uniref:hypothetical protein n=1 Tax=Mycolicibacterium hodleri TaxID=49897 RepID=UPI0021F3832F|nr:hypothetical protein [Mycolicibacterium hodleri]MCV7132907.1 hypothetical protein [Mycolicibacterium hodleri]